MAAGRSASGQLTESMSSTRARPVQAPLTTIFSKVMPTSCAMAGVPSISGISFSVTCVRLSKASISDRSVGPPCL